MALAMCMVAWLVVVAGNGKLGLAVGSPLVGGKDEGRGEDAGME